MVFQNSRSPRHRADRQIEKPDATIYEHAIAGMEFFWSQFSERGLPLILKADWKDALNQMGNDRNGESSMLVDWATGTACWALLNVQPHMFGVEPEAGGLRIEVGISA